MQGRLKSPAIAAGLALWLAGISNALAAPCCASNAVVPSLISGDHRTQLGLGVSQSAVIGDAPTQGIPIFRSADSSEITRTVSIDAATLLSDRWQAGVGTSLAQRSLLLGPQSANGSGMGDLKVSLAFEAWPEFTYTRWKPRGYVFGQVIAPTGRSLFEARDPLLADATGQGIFQTGIGALLLKQRGQWDAYLLPEIHAGFAREFSNGTRLGPSWGASFALGLGYQPALSGPLSPLRLGWRLQPTYRSARTVQSAALGTFSSAAATTSYQLNWNTALEAAYLIGTQWSVFASYVDQTLVGPAVNSTLSRTFSLTLQRRWDR